MEERIKELEAEIDRLRVVASYAAQFGTKVTLLEVVQREGSLFAVVMCSSDKESEHELIQVFAQAFKNAKFEAAGEAYEKP